MNLRFNSDLMIYFLFTTFLKLIASFSGKKVADYSEQSSRRVSSFVGAYWNPCSVHVVYLYCALITLKMEVLV